MGSLSCYKCIVVGSCSVIPVFMSRNRESVEGGTGRLAGCKVAFLAHVIPEHVTPCLVQATLIFVITVATLMLIFMS